MSPADGDRIGELVEALLLEEKVALLAGIDSWHTPEVPRLDVPSFRMTDGPVGARGTRFTGGPPSACFPCGTALAATWDADLVRDVGAELGAETRAKGAHLLLAPTVNMHRTPLAGRNFECYSEDPELAGRIATAYIRGVQSQGVGACIKHFVANDSEYERFTISSEVPERALREIYLRPFEVAIAQAHPVAVMAAYNKLDGVWCSEHPWLLTSVLRGEWGYDGLVVSDWYGTHTTVDAIEAGLDLEMPGPTRHRGDALVSSVASGDVAEAIVDASVARLLLAMERTGALDAGPRDERSDDAPRRRAVARRAAGGAIVLLKNDGVLPLAPASLRRVAVVGPSANALNILGGGSASVTPYYATSVYEAIAAALAPHKVTVVTEPGCSITRYPPSIDVRCVTTATGDPGCDVTIVDGTDPGGTDVLDRHVAGSGALRWAREDAAGPWAARLTANYRAPADGAYVFQGSGSGRFRILVDSTTVVDSWDVADAGSSRRVEGSIVLTAGEEYALRAELVARGGAEGFGGADGIEVRCQPPLPEDAFERAVRAASEADVAVVVVGTNGDWETEGRDRRTFELPGRQAELIEAVCAANEKTVVVVNAGAPVAMDWAERAPAVLQSWFLGQESGNAVADVLTGAVDASGRLPTTIPKALRDTPGFTNYPGEFGRVHYGEGLFVGYRWYDARGIEPRFAFGHGLSYTSFDYGPMTATARGQSATVELSIANVGERDGVETVQLYVRDVECSAVRPPKELKAFSKVALAAGAATRVTFELDRPAFAFWHPGEGGWRVEPGEFEILVGASSADIRRRATITI